MGAMNLHAQSDSLLVINQVTSEYNIQEVHFIRCFQKVQEMTKHFRNFEMIYVLRKENSMADLLLKLASTKRHGS